jgi:CBS domain-containing protein
MSAWAGPRFEEDEIRLPSAVEEGLAVGLIATFDLATCQADDELTDVRAREDLKIFDHVPVKEGKYIVGLLDRTGRDSDAGSVRDAMQPLNESNLISAEASILSFIESAEDHPCRLVLRNSRIDGIVTIADLQKLPVRPALFLLITHVELLMARWIRSRGLLEDTLLSKLSEGRRNKTEDKWVQLQTDNLAVDKVSATEFCDKVDLLMKCDFPVVSKVKARSELKRIEGLRDMVAHAGDYALTAKNAVKTIETVRMARRWISRLEEELEQPQ